MEEQKTTCERAKKEEEILKFWESQQIYKKSKAKNLSGKPFYFMDGPPYANGHIHMGTALNKTLKDIFMRSRRLQGFDVFDRPGYDTHGMPIEYQVEKEIGTKSKKDIEVYGLKKFIDRCKTFATEHIDFMNKEFMNLGVWMDFENAYLTLSDEYIEAIWSAFKEADKKNLLYLGKYPVHLCTRCETAVAYNEIEYGKQKDTSIFVKFPLKNKPNTFLLIWTTTPWTLPANTGVMVHPEYQYQEVEVAEGERWIIAKDLVPNLMMKLERGFTPKEEFQGKVMEGWGYINPLAKYLKLNIKKGYQVVLSSRYVSAEDGTGLVHCAPGHGKEDFEVGREYGLDMPSPVANDGLLTEEAGKYAGKRARVVDTEIIEDLEKDGALVYKMTYEHDYPLCWRDKTPLLMISQPQWFFKVSEIQKKLILENEKVNWVPGYMQLRMKAWLEGIGDWPVSRQRYWGTPLPIWFNEETGEKIVVGSIKELQELSGKKKIGMHKPEIDEIMLKGKDGKPLKRVPGVLDVWFDSGVTSWAALGYPKDSLNMKKYWPADLNIEGRDQFRGWWNSQLILSEITFDKKPFKNVIVHGMVLDLGKKKMSKSLGNVTDPASLVSKFSRDGMRYYFAKMSKGEDFSYDEKEFTDIEKTFMVLTNINTFINQLQEEKSKLAVEDKWILSKYHTLLREVKRCYAEYKLPEAVTKLEQFIIMDLSRTYIQLIRERSNETATVLKEIRRGILLLFAPILPFITERIWQELTLAKEEKEESIHLAKMPEPNPAKIDETLETTFGQMLSFMEMGNAERDKVKIGLRWPLASATFSAQQKLPVSMQEILARQLNVKKIFFEKSQATSVKLDTTQTPELEAEGYAREFARRVQAERKKAGLKKGELVGLTLFCSSTLQAILEKNQEMIAERINAKSILFSQAEIQNSSNVVEFEIKGKKICFKFS